MNSYFQKVYKSNGLVIYDRVLTGTKWNGKYEDFSEATNRRFLSFNRSSSEECALVTEDENRKYKELEEKFRSKAQTTGKSRKIGCGKKPIAISRVSFDLNSKSPVGISGPLVLTENDNNLETSRVEEILVQWPEINLNAEYFDAPWWQNLINKTKEKYGVEIDESSKGFPQDHHYPRGGIYNPHPHHSREELIFRLETKNEKEFEKYIGNVFKAGTIIKNAMKHEEKRLMQFFS
jgi:hypothetical protein